MKPSGAHTHPGMGGGGTVLVIEAIIVGAAVAAPVARTVDSLLNAVAEAVEITLIVLAAAVGLAVIAGLVLLTAKLRLRSLRRLVPISSRQPLRVLQPSDNAFLLDRLTRIEQHLGIDDGRKGQPPAIEPGQPAPLRSSPMPIERWLGRREPRGRL